MINTIYIGGGTPSLLKIAETGSLIEKIYSLFKVSPQAEITIEINPDDVTPGKLAGWREMGINRLSLGVQSFFEDELRWMNRAHTVEQAHSALQSAIKYFDNISIDLIYGTPALTNEKWEQNIQHALAYHIPHLSCYALTVEKDTPLHKLIRMKKKRDVNQDMQSDQFILLMQRMEESGYEHYEISNFAKPGFRSRHNASYWQGEKYLGMGPAAHSFDGTSRQWNVANNNIYIGSIKNGSVPLEKEILTVIQRTNEYIMTSLRTIEGLYLDQISVALRDQVKLASRKFLDLGLMIENQNHLKLTARGKLLADGIAADLFLTDDSVASQKK